ncbi:hypothetical protein Poly30_50560 [Planctomycetes bacterium Poly30]|uniref:Peptidase A2 domain-containing protein n=1 Tax=Saltatorellus ferox TaxID=2528018 RepID=A0A518EZJ3_9BACT|nr:hypothetical protein Poly30_50560 [Planctomycetes bacterium Poly30]
MRLAQITLLLATGVGLAACEVTPPVRVLRPTRGLFQEIREAVGTDALFGERTGLTYAGVRVYPGPDDGTGAMGEGVERPLTLSLKPTGAFLLSVGTEEAAAAQGFDGRAAWTLDPRGVSRELGLGAREYLLADGWLRTFLWLTPGDERFTITPVEPTGGATTIELRLERVGEPLEATLVVDAASRRPLSYSMTRNARVREVRFADWRVEDGVWFPHEMTETVDGSIVHVDRFARRTRGTPRTFGTPRSLPTDTSFDETAAGGRGKPVEARVDQGGRFYVRARIDDHEEAWMLLDTGFSSHAIHVELAETLELATGSVAQLQGVSGGGAGRWTEATTLAVGPLTQSRPRLVTVDTSFLSARAGFEVAGILGAPLFERAVVTLDEPRGRVTLHDPRGFERRGLRWVPLQQDGSSPCIGGQLTKEGRVSRTLWFRIDTGSDDTITIAEWASREFDLVGDRAQLRATRLEGAFGTVLGWRSTLEAIVLGNPTPASAGGSIAPGDEASLILQRPEVTLLRSSAPGPLSDPWIAGNLGTRGLRGCSVVLDVSAGRIAFQ